MAGIINWIVLIYLLWITALIGFAYLILLMAKKESGKTKLVGQIIACSIVILALIIIIWAGINGSKMKQGMYGMMNMKMNMAKMMMDNNCKMPGMGKHKMMGKNKMGNMIESVMKNMSKEDIDKCMKEAMKNPDMKKCIENYLKTKK